jgi:DNA-binding MarR family transcriptional regulator
MLTIDNELSAELYLNFQKILRSLNFGRGLNKTPSITGTQMRILSLFNEKEIVHISEISRVLGMSIQSANNIVRRLETLGYVTISKNEKDKRLSDIRLSDYGMEGLEAFRDGQLQSISHIIDSLSTVEKELLNAAVKNAALILAKGSEKAAKKESSPEAELSDEYLL